MKDMCCGGREGEKEIEQEQGEKSVQAWLMSTGEMCLLSTEQRLQGK